MLLFVLLPLVVAKEFAVEILLTLVDTADFGVDAVVGVNNSSSCRFADKNGS